MQSWVAPCCCVLRLDQSLSPHFHSETAVVGTKIITNIHTTTSPFVMGATITTWWYMVALNIAICKHVHN